MSWLQKHDFFLYKCLIKWHSFSIWTVGNFQRQKKMCLLWKGLQILKIASSIPTFALQPKCQCYGV